MTYEDIKAWIDLIFTRNGRKAITGTHGNELGTKLLDFIKTIVDKIGVASGIASLGEDGKVPTEQLPTLGEDKVNIDQSTKQTLTSSPKIQDLTADRLPYVSADKSIKSSGFLEVDEVNKNLKVGTGTPSSKTIFDVVGDVDGTSISAIPQMQVVNTSTTAAQAQLAMIRVLTGTGNGNYPQLRLVAYRDYYKAELQIRGVTNHPMIFYTNNAEWIRLLPTGETGFGTSNPTEKVDVVGNIKATGSVQVGATLDIASIDNVGAIRYRLFGSYSVWERCTQIAATTETPTFEWQVETKNEW